MGCAPPRGLSRASCPRASDGGGGRRRPGRPPEGDRRSANRGPLLGSGGRAVRSCTVPFGRPEASGCRTGRPPNAARPPFVPGAGTPTPRVPDGSGGVGSARGYPAAVSTPVGADPAVVGPYLSSV